MKISNPFKGKTVRQYQAVQGAQGSIPRYNAWMQSTSLSGPRDPVVQRIDECLRLYENTWGDGWGRLSLLGELFFCTNNALKSAGPALEGPLNDLFLTVVDQLCRAFSCTPNFLPQMLEECWGRVLTKHGHHIDTMEASVGGIPTVATYLSRAEVEKYKIRFQAGRAYMRVRPKYDRWVLANSGGIGWTYHPSIKEQMMYPGYAGFSLSMGRELFMAHHRGGFDKNNFFHSSYLSGDSVLCTGTIQIEHGIVKAIANDSGHYQPSIDHLVNVVQTFRMHGVDVGQVVVYAAPKSWKNDKGIVQNTWGTWWGTDLLNRRGNGFGLYQRMQANQVNIGNRQGTGPAATPGVTLPAANRLPPPPPRT
ncbi:MAG TPA: hypothetical protein VG938_06945 [Verrucomicrobiae bacterium]|jgi:hypothetical protein|nr:hypothetical protein [Verrucomicrobiae bacterium]